MEKTNKKKESRSRHTNAKKYTNAQVTTDYCRHIIREKHYDDFFFHLSRHITHPELGQVYESILWLLVYYKYDRHNDIITVIGNTIIICTYMYTLCRVIIRRVKF